MKKDVHASIESKKYIEQSLKKYLFWVIVIILFILSIFIIKPFIIALISAFILSYLIRPIHEKFSLKFNKKLSAIICILLILIIIIIPTAILAGAIANQIKASQDFNFGSIINKISSLSFLNNINLDELKEKSLSVLLSLITSVLSYLPYLVLSMLITILGIYYMLINWEYLSNNLESFLPFRDKKRIRNEISNITKNIVYGYLLIALIEFAVAAFGFYISNVDAFLLLAMLIALFAFIPGIGPGVVWMPTSIYYFITNNYPTAIGVLITGLIISILIETFLLGKIVGKKAKIHPLIFLLGVLGGVPLFGIFGFIIGPLILIYSIKLIEEGLSHN